MIDRNDPGTGLVTRFLWAARELGHYGMTVIRKCLDSSKSDRTSTGRSPERIDSRTFRDAMGHLATGVTVISTQGTEGPHGMTANAVTSVSLDPPLILVCVSRAARLDRYLASGQRFAVNILGQDQEPLSRYFSRTWPASDTPPVYSFECVDDSPALAGSITSVICDVHERYRGGDHDIVLGRVRAIRSNETAREPLIFFRGKYASLTEESMMPAIGSGMEQPLSGGSSRRIAMGERYHPVLAGSSYPAMRPGISQR